MAESTTTGAARPVSCPLCGSHTNEFSGTRCPTCGADLALPAIAMIAEADEAIAQCQSSYDLLAARWTQWNVHRASLIEQVQRSRSAPTTQPGFASPTTPAPMATPKPVPASAPAPMATPALATAPAAPAWPAAPQEQYAPRAVAPRRTRRLTVPVMLGIAGASLLIAAAVIFVAVSWTTIHPAFLGALILAVAAAVAYISTWLGRQNLAVSGGAVGVVAASFAGVSVFAFDRGSGVLGNFAAAGALLVTSAAGLFLARHGVRWVQSFAALAVVGAGAAATLGFVALGVDSYLPWLGVAGALSGALVGATHPLWRGAVAPRIVRFGAVSGVTAAGLAAAAVALSGPSRSAINAGANWRLELVLGLVAPLLVLIAWHWAWPRAVAAPLGLAVPAVVGTLVSLGAVPWWASMAATAVAVAALVWWSGSWPRAHRVPALLGLIPAAGVLAITAAVAAGAALGSVLSMLFQGAGFTFDAGLGVVAIACLAIVLALRRWQLAPALRAAAETTGAALMVVGTVMFATAITQSQWPDQRAALGLALLVAAAAMFAARWVWQHRIARVVSTVSGVSTVTVAGLLGSLGLAQGLAVGDNAGAAISTTLAAVLPILALAVVMRWEPLKTATALALLLTVVAAAGAAAAGAPAQGAAAAALVTAAGVVWILGIVPRSWRGLVKLGLLPAVAAGALAVLTSLVAPHSSAAGFAMAGSFAWAVVLSVLLALIAAGALRVAAQADERDSTAVFGVLMTLAAAVSGLLWAAGHMDQQWVLTLAGFGFATLAYATYPVWQPAPARQVLRVGVTVGLALEMLLALGVVAFRDFPTAQSLVPAVVGVGLLAVAARRWLRITSGPATFALAVLVPATVYGVGGSLSATAFAATATVAALAWAATSSYMKDTKPMLWGLAVPMVVVGAMAAWGIGWALLNYAWTITGGEPYAPRWWTVGIAGAVLGGLLAWPKARPHWPWLAGISIFVSASAVSPLVGALAGVTYAVALGGLAAVSRAGVRRYSAVVRWTALAAAASSIGFSAEAYWSVSLSSLFAAAIAWWIVVDVAPALRVAGPGVEPASVPDPEPRSGFAARNAAIVVAVLFGAMAVGFGAAAISLSGGIAVVAAAAVAIASTLFARVRSFESDPQVGIVLMGFATIVPSWWAGSFEVAGVAVLIAAVGWWTLRLTGWRPGMWVAALVTSVGVALVLVGASIAVPEAYFATPAGCALAIGWWEMRSRPPLRSFAALGPGLALALVPSYVAMIVDPSVTARVLVLVAATLVLAMLGVLARWFAPVLAACLTAVAIAITQVLVTDNSGIRWVSFAVVGVLLLVIAATYEKLKKLR